MSSFKIGDLVTTRSRLHDDPRYSVGKVTSIKYFPDSTIPMLYEVSFPDLFFSIFEKEDDLVSLKVSSKTEESSLFCIIEKCEGYRVIYNKDTKVMYWSSYGPYNSGNLTLLVNADGTPQIYKGSE